MELYFEDLERAKDFYSRVLGLELSDESRGHFAQFGGEAGFLCLEKRGTEPYPSMDKAVVFLQVRNLREAIERIGPERVLQANLQGEGRRQPWAVLHDPEGHNVVLLERHQRIRKAEGRGASRPRRAR